MCTEDGCFSKEEWSSSALGIAVLAGVCGLLAVAVMIIIVLVLLRH